MVDYAHLPVLELLRQIDSRVRTATEQAIETQTDLNYKVAKDLAEFGRLDDANAKVGNRELDPDSAP